jgi:hypothetical protein
VVQTKKKSLKKKKKKKKKRTKKTTTTIFNPQTDPHPDRNSTFEKKTNPDLDRCQKVNPAGL